MAFGFGVQILWVDGCVAGARVIGGGDFEHHVVKRTCGGGRGGEPSGCHDVGLGI